MILLDLLNEKSPRIIIIVGSSKIDDALADIIGKVLLPKSAKRNDQDELLEGDFPLSTFSARVKMLYRLGLIDNSFYKVIEKIRKIRNIGAHKLAFDIDSSPLREHVYDLYKLVEQRKSFLLTKERYFRDEPDTNINKLKCALLSVCVLLQVIKSKTHKLKVQRTLHKITSN